ncbi:heme/hemin ABC transporter substrate-binding protein [Szabonella alba]|uniref:ABC transporter substrate-binding protein n=1 Tax=Szabonella alba TaxID=2804194 RepID=A0A8K0VBM8_9RHOB|nr:ABC transporter substrate-binding protein [Szabonella alba]MBL4916910.1 ABC transporter substrate-binding protein [Szabonella alba]
MIRAILLALALPGMAMADSPATDSAARVVSLGGSVTEIAVALGAGDRLVGRDTTSNYPDSVLDLPDVGYIRALSPEGVLSLGPDLILSEAGAGPAEAVTVLQAAGVPFIQMPGDPTPEGVLDKIDAVAAALNLPEAGAALHDSVAEGLEAARQRAAEITAPKSVLFVLSLTAGRVTAGGAGSAAEGIIELAGGRNAAQGFDGWKQMTDEAVIASAPDVILMMEREGDLAVTDADVLAHPALSLTPAAKTGRILRMDGMLVLGFGPRTPEAAATLHDAIYGTGSGGD